MNPTAVDIGPVDVPNQRSFVPVGAIAALLAERGPLTALAIAYELGSQTRQVLETLNLLARDVTVYVFGEGGPDRARLEHATLAVFRREDGTGEVLKGWNGRARLVSAAELAVLEQHEPVERFVPNTPEGKACPALWRLVGPGDET